MVWENFVSTLLDNSAALGLAGAWLWYQAKKLNKVEEKLDKCEEARESLSKEHSDIRVELEALKVTVNGHRPGGYKHG